MKPSPSDAITSKSLTREPNSAIDPKIKTSIGVDGLNNSAIPDAGQQKHWADASPS